MNNISNCIYDKFEANGFIRPIILSYLNRLQEAAFHYWVIKFCLIFSISAWPCFYNVLRFWPNVGLNVLINEVLIKKTCIWILTLLYYKLIIHSQPIGASSRFLFPNISHRNMCLHKFVSPISLNHKNSKCNISERDNWFLIINSDFSTFYVLTTLHPEYFIVKFG